LTSPTMIKSAPIVAPDPDRGNTVRSLHS
jgi:hypothetical protein